MVPQFFLQPWKYKEEIDNCYAFLVLTIVLLQCFYNSTKMQYHKSTIKLNMTCGTLITVPEIVRKLYFGLRYFYYRGTRLQSTNVLQTMQPRGRIMSACDTSGTTGDQPQQSPKSQFLTSMLSSRQASNNQSSAGPIG